MENGKHNAIINNKYLDIPKQILFKICATLLQIPIQRSEKVTQNKDKKNTLVKKTSLLYALIRKSLIHSITFHTVHIL